MDEQMSSSLELLTKERDGPALAGFVVQLVGGGVDDARALLQKALAHLEPPPAATASASAASAATAAAAAAAQTAAGGNGTSSEKKRPAPDDAVAQASNKVARAGDTSGPSSGGASSGGEVVELNYFKRDAHDDGDDRLMLLVPDNAVSNIIGKAGHTVKQIQSSTDVKVDIQTSAEMVPGQRERRVTLRGSIKNTNIGAYLVGMKVGEKLQADRPGSDMQLSMKVLVPDQSVSFIIGKQGVMINEIQSLSGGRVQIEKAAEMLPGLGGRVVTITGPARARLMAQYLISRAVAQHMAPIGGPAGGGVAGGSVSVAGGQVTMEMFVQNSLVARLIGKQGQNVTQLQTNSGAKVQIQKEADMMASGRADRMVSLVGSQAAVSKCQSLIATQLSQWADAGYATGPAPSSVTEQPRPVGVNYPPPASYTPLVQQQPPGTLPTQQQQQPQPQVQGVLPNGAPVYYQMPPGYTYPPPMPGMQPHPGMVPAGAGAPATPYPGGGPQYQYQSQAQAAAAAAAAYQSSMQYHMGRAGAPMTK
jgi:transcription antitermination factor NusA-like protein